MDERGKQFLKAYLEQEGHERLRKYLSSKNLTELESLADVTVPSSFVWPNPIECIHWSWFLSILQDCSDAEKQVFIAVLPEHGATALSNALHVQPEAHLTEAAKSYFSGQLYQRLLQTKPAPLPADALPENPLNQLVQYSKKELLRLINYLSLFDLAVEIRQIVETKILKKLYSFLQEGEKAFLKQAPVIKEGAPLPKMGLDKWDGTEESLRHMLHKRGVQWLAIALSGSHPDLIWHIAHQLDSGRGGTLLKLVMPEPVPHWTDLATRHIQEWIKQA